MQYHPEYSLLDIVGVLERYRPILLADKLVADDAALDSLCADLKALHADPARRDLAWRYGLDADVIDAERRYTELRNWIERRVKPAASERGRI